MTNPPVETSNSSGSSGAAVVQAVTVIMGTVVGLTFMFGFGNVLTLALELGIPGWVAPLVAPAIDLSILGLLLGTRHLAMRRATAAELRPARRLLIFASLTTLALNIAEPIVTGAYGKAAFDAVGPLLLIGWAEVGPGFLQAINAVVAQPYELALAGTDRLTPMEEDRNAPISETEGAELPTSQPVEPDGQPLLPEELLERARREDAAHRAVHQRPISADTLRRQMAIGAKRSRQLVALVRSEAQTQAKKISDDLDMASEESVAHAA